MRQLRRLPLSSATVGFLRDRTKRVRGASDPKLEAKRLWSAQQNRAFAEIREILGRMASGLERCMYCEDSEGTAIEHFWPKATFPKKAFTWKNYLIACTRCNSNFKRDRFPRTFDGKPLLINPTEEDPFDFLDFSPTTGMYESKLPKGVSSIDVFGLNRPILTKGRKDAWISLEQLLVRYGNCKRSRDHSRASAIEGVVQRSPFAGVMVALLRVATSPAATLLISADCLQTIREHPEIKRWV